MSAGTRASDTDGAGLATPAGAASPIHSMLPGPGAGPNAVNPASAGSTAEVIPFTVTATAASGGRRRHHGALCLEYHLAAAGLKPAGTGTDAPAAGATVKVSSASAAVAGSGVTPAMRKYSTRAFSGSLFTRLSTAPSGCRTAGRGPRRSHRERIGPVRGEARDPGLNRRADRFLAGREQDRLNARGPRPVGNHGLTPGFGLPPPPHLGGLAGS